MTQTRCHDPDLAQQAQSFEDMRQELRGFKMPEVTRQGILSAVSFLLSQGLGLRAFFGCNFDECVEVWPFISENCD